MIETIQQIKITKAELDKLSEDFLMRALRIFALQQDWIRLCVTAAFLPNYLREKIFELILSDKSEEINSQAKKGYGFFVTAGRPTSREEALGLIIDECIRQGLHNQEDIVSRVGTEMDKKLVVLEIESVVLDCVNKRRFDLALEAANSLPMTKRAQVIAILS